MTYAYWTPLKCEGVEDPPIPVQLTSHSMADPVNIHHYLKDKSTLRYSQLFIFWTALKKVVWKLLLLSNSIVALLKIFMFGLLSAGIRPLYYLTIKWPYP